MFYRGRKLERSYSRGYEEGSSGNTKREYSRSASDNNWRDKRQEEDDEEEGSWRNARDPNPRWGEYRRDLTKVLIVFLESEEIFAFGVGGGISSLLGGGWRRGLLCRHGV